ncbi:MULTISPECIES: aldo/keto reductase [unclassified Curtobacterium]|uniref:aldo/keto reductase n=1 Tax=unclassified Curtobacterium TaxID=257496 RepID=UPI000DA99F21|nr:MULTISPECIES: aldo/keto reductase [unclassified Curtobacterium]WIB64675.1 aldo/keto reductase [Curtobacterium sp. MCBD17_040]WIB68520.1 aldo/keto reductase [Curtobacterium sp. MCBD17_035]
MSSTAAVTRYDTMPYNRVGRSGLLLPAIALGLWQNFGDDRPYATQRAIVRRAFDLGVTHFDLANNYGPPYGSAEVTFGRVLREDLRHHRDELIVSTKAGYDMWAGPYGEFGSRKSMIASLDQSLGRLGLEYVDVFYSHRYDPDTPIEETMGALASAVTSGKALYVGVSNHDADQTRRAAAALADLGVPLLVNQPPYSMFDREAEHALIPTLAELGTGAVVYSPLAQGLLTDRYLGATIPGDSRVVAGRDLPASALDGPYRERARALAAIAADRGQTLAQLALTWVLRHPEVASALVGASSVPQLEQNLRAATAPPLTPAELAAIEPYAVDGTAA